MAHDLAEYEDRLIESAQAVIDAWEPDEFDDESLAPIPTCLLRALDDAVSEFTRACQAVLPGEEDTDDE